MADHDEYNDGNESNRIDDTDARMKIQEMIDDLRGKYFFFVVVLFLMQFLTLDP